MAGERSLDRDLGTRGSPLIRKAVHVGKASVFSAFGEGEASLSGEGEPSLSGEGTHNWKPQSHIIRARVSPERVADDISVGHPECHSKTDPFDICKAERVTHVKLNLSLLEINRLKRKEAERAKVGPQHHILRPGMILLKNHISQNDQIEIIKQCQKFGIGSGGFYQPCYRDSVKMKLQMMCLGKNWDPETRLYEDIRPNDGVQPPKIPEHFNKLVEDTIQTSHTLIKQCIGGHRCVEDELPTMTPNICIVNFYNTTGKLGLHQDRDESKESLSKGLPVVSFSLGDSADFLYGERRDADKASNVTLENGDVLIFGGKSRHVFHGVKCIHPNTAPKWLVDKTGLRPGRLNLTFRQY